MLVDAEPKDKLLKIATSTGTLITAFGTNGFVDAPTNKTEGITFLDTGDPSTSYLWIVTNESFDRKLYKINITTGAVVGSPFNLNSTANIFDDIGGIASDGTNLILYFKSFNETVKIDPSNGFEVERSFFCCPNAFGAKGFARHSSRDQYYAAKDASLLTLDSSLQEVVRSRRCRSTARSCPVTSRPGLRSGRSFRRIQRGLYGQGQPWGTPRHRRDRAEGARVLAKLQRAQRRLHRPRALDTCRRRPA